MSYGYSDRQNKLAQWANFFDKQGGSIGGNSMYQGVPVYGDANPNIRMDYADRMMQQEDAANIADKRSNGIPNYYGQQQSLPQQQYVQPQMFQNDNPNSQYNSQNNQNSGITNYLNTVMARRTQRG